MKEIGFTFLGALLLAIVWTFLIMKDGLKDPVEFISIIETHLQQYGAYFIFFDILIFGLFMRWIHLVRKKKPPTNQWE